MDKSPASWDFLEKHGKLRQNLDLRNHTQKWYGSCRAVRSDGAAHGPKFKIPLPRSFVPGAIEYACQVSSTSSARRSQNFRVLKTLAPNGRQRAPSPAAIGMGGVYEWLGRLCPPWAKTIWNFEMLSCDEVHPYVSCYGRPLSVSGRPCYILPMFFYYFLWPPYSPALVNGGSRKFYTW